MRTPPPPRAPREGRAGFWPAVAIIAIMVATAGWTTVAVMALNGGGGEAAAGAPTDDESFAPGDSADDGDIGASDEPIVETHDAPDLEALLPNRIDDTDMTLQSWTGSGLLEDGGQWADSITKYLGTVGKTTDDLSAAQSYDATEATDSSINLFRLDGVPPESLRDAMIAAWKDSYPDMTVTLVKLDGTEVSKGDFGEDAIDSYWYIKDGLVYDIEASDETAATAILKGIRDGTLPLGPTTPPAGGGPSGSPGPASAGPS